MSARRRKKRGLWWMKNCRVCAGAGASGHDGVVAVKLARSRSAALASGLILSLFYPYSTGFSSAVYAGSTSPNPRSRWSRKPDRPGALRLVDLRPGRRVGPATAWPAAARGTISTKGKQFHVVRLDESGSNKYGTRLRSGGTHRVPMADTFSPASGRVGPAVVSLRKAPSSGEPAAPS